MARLFIDCRRAHRLLSHRRDAPLRWLDRLRLRIHLSVCDWCTIVARNLDFLSRAVRRLDR